MKNLATLLFIFLGSLFWAQEGNDNKTNSVFWKITHPGSKKVSYLFGTMHMIDEDKYVLPEFVDEKLRSCDKLFLELGDLNPGMETVKLALLKEGRMTDLLSQVQKDSVYSFAEDEFGLDSVKFEAIYGKFKPFFFAQLPMMKVMTKCESYDKNFDKIAREEKIKVEGLETMKEQVSFFDAMSPELQVEMIMSTVRGSDDFEAHWQSMQAMYLNQNIEEMMVENGTSKKMQTFMENVIMKKRNTKWTTTLVPSLKQENLFIGVGAGHLLGDYGLVSLLSAEGFLVEPINIQFTK